MGRKFWICLIFKNIPSKTWHCFLGLVDTTSSYSGLRKRRKYKQFFFYFSSLGTKQWLIMLVVDSGIWCSSFSELTKKAHTDQNSFHHWYAKLHERTWGQQASKACAFIYGIVRPVTKESSPSWSWYSTKRLEGRLYVKPFICRTLERNKVQTFAFWMLSCKNCTIKWYF